MKELIYYINNITGEDEHCILNKKLNNYVNTCFDKGIDYGSKQRQFAIEMSDYYGGEIPQNILDTFINENYVDYIHENLSTHNAPLLQKKLLKFFSNSINRFIDYDGTIEIYSFYIIVNNDVNVESFKKNKKLLDLLQFFNYKIRETKQIENENVLFIEPIFSENVDDWVYKNCKGICYHFTTREAADNILKTGFRIRNNAPINIPTRNYMYATDKLSIRSGDEYINAFIDKVTNVFDVTKYGLAVLRIDLHRARGNRYITFYKDTAMSEPEAVFTYNNIPAACVKEVNYKQIKK